MDNGQKSSAADAGTPAQKPRKPWTRPRVTRMRAGEAELGATPVKPEGPFAFGS
ncbi:MAG TPA: hypothetical protein VIC34_15095 [Croceibacterium sp.]|jgi:hypothetical protein